MRISDKGKHPAFRKAGQSAGDKKARTPGHYPPPFSLRLSFEERAKLEQAAGGMPLGAFIREKLLGSDFQPRRTRGRSPVKDHQLLGRVLGELGRSHLANNLNQLARAANTGSLPVTPETENALKLVCKEITQIRHDLVRALGLSSEVEP